MIAAAIEPTFSAWRSKSRDLLAFDVPPDRVIWEEVREGGQSSLFGGELGVTGPSSPRARVPSGFVDLARLVAHHRDASKWPLLYRVLYRLSHGESHLLRMPTDPDMNRLDAMRASVRRDEHKMHAFVRFRRVGQGDPEHFVAWYAPDHLIVPLVAPFFKARFSAMRWAILTPDASVTWDTERLSFGAGVARSSAPGPDETESLFREYYGAIFNPARINLKAMRAEMPKKHWSTLPETRSIPELVRAAPERLGRMTRERVSESTAFVPDGVGVGQLRSAAKECKACDLYARANQVVFGEGPSPCDVMLVGEQPGDQEDTEGKPFVGPAGRVLNEVLVEVGLERGEIYVTNAVKHFKWEPRGKRRLHMKPNTGEVNACRGWLEAEIAAVRPKVIVCLGATAAQSFIGPKFSIQKNRGQVFETPWAPFWMATYHPSALLRIPDVERREEAKALFRQDLASVARHLRERVPRAS